MSRIGLALSGGGFRATLYHLGVVRYLRDANLLHQVSHITSVSGGSIMAAHLVLHWDRYTGSEEDYDEVSKEILNFVRMDVRNRVVRRFPMAFVANSLRWVLGRSRSRRLTRPGLLEAHYEKFLFGERCLYELPAVPQLHILATNVNEGCLCSFTRSGIIVQRRVSGHESRFELVPSAIATLPMAVTASSAFPGFFPPLQLTARDVGVNESRFPPHLFTDGGVYDNLGVRMFRNIQDSWIGHDTPLRPDDFVDVTTAARVFSRAAAEPENTPLNRLGRLVADRTGQTGSYREETQSDLLPTSLWNVIVHDRLYLDSAFDNLKLVDEKAGDLYHMARRGRNLEPGDHLWLNRYLINATFADAGQGDLLVSTQATFDSVIVSDAGKQFSVSRRTKGGGLLGTAMRASDILMNRVWELECDHFRSESDFVFAPMSLTVHHAEDPTAPHPEIQHQVASTRTDLDRFSDLEISGLVRHGYCVMRKVCRSRPDLFGDDSPSEPPWDPTSISKTTSSSSDDAPNPVTAQARELQNSSQRRVLSRLLSWRDWPTYVFVPLLILLLIGTPYYAYQQYKLAHRSELIVDAITFSNPDFQLVLQLARQNPVPGNWEPLIATEVDQLEPTNLGGFRLITDTRILDARAFVPNSTSPLNRIVSYRRMLVRRITDGDVDGDGDQDVAPSQEVGRLRLQQFNPTSDVSFRSTASDLNPVLRKTAQTLPNGERGFLYEAAFDLTTVPSGEDFDIGFESTSSGVQGRRERSQRLTFPIVAPTDVATMWVLLPPGRPYTNVELVGYQQFDTSTVRSVEPTYRFEMADGSLFGWMLVAPRDGHMYECRWDWGDE